MTKISVIIPVYNDPEGLRDTLESLVNQKFPKEHYEVLPVDNNSTDNTDKVIEEFEENYPDLVRGLEENDIQGSYAARNEGIRESKGNILVFTDADMWWDDDVLTEAFKEFSNTDIDYLGGQIEVVIEKYSIYSLLASRMFRDTGRRLNEANFVPTAFLAVNKNVIDDVGGFDERMFSSADSVFGKKVAEAGYVQRFSEDIHTYHPARSSFNSLISRRIKLGRGGYEFHKYHPDLKSTRHPLHPRNFLPTLPSRLRENLEGWKGLSIFKKIQIYFVYWIREVSEPYGYIKAYLKDKIGN